VLFVRGGMAGNATRPLEACVGAPHRFVWNRGSSGRIACRRSFAGSGYAPSRAVDADSSWASPSRYPRGSRRRGGTGRRTDAAPRRVLSVVTAADGKSNACLPSFRTIATLQCAGNIGLTISLACFILACALCGGVPSVEAEDLGDAESILKKTQLHRVAARRLVQQGIILREDGWGLAWKVST